MPPTSLQLLLLGVEGLLDQIDLRLQVQSALLRTLELLVLEGQLLLVLLHFIRAAKNLIQFVLYEFFLPFRHL